MLSRSPFTSGPCRSATYRPLSRAYAFCISQIFTWTAIPASAGALQSHCAASSLTWPFSPAISVFTTQGVMRQLVAEMAALVPALACRHGVYGILGKPRFYRDGARLSSKPACACC